MKVTNMVSGKGNTVPNQFVIEWDDSRTRDHIKVFQSYATTIAKRVMYPDGRKVTYLDDQAWNYSRTTAKYRNQFLRETTKETKAKIESGEYILTDLNKGE